MARRAGRDAIHPVVGLQMGDVGAADQDFRRHAAADIDAGAADHLTALDEGHPRAILHRAKAPEPLPTMAICRGWAVTIFLLVSWP